MTTTKLLIGMALVAIVAGCDLPPPDDTAVGAIDGKGESKGGGGLGVDNTTLLPVRISGCGPNVTVHLRDPNNPLRRCLATLVNPSDFSLAALPANARQQLIDNGYDRQAAEKLFARYVGAGFRAGQLVPVFGHTNYLPLSYRPEAPSFWEASGIAQWSEALRAVVFGFDGPASDQHKVIKAAIDVLSRPSGFNFLRWRTQQGQAPPRSSSWLAKLLPRSQATAQVVSPGFVPDALLQNGIAEGWAFLALNWGFVPDASGRLTFAPTITSNGYVFQFDQTKTRLGAEALRLAAAAARLAGLASEVAQALRLSVAFVGGSYVLSQKVVGWAGGAQQWATLGDLWLDRISVTELEGDGTLSEDTRDGVFEQIDAIANGERGGFGDPLDLRHCAVGAKALRNYAALSVEQAQAFQLTAAAVFFAGCSSYQLKKGRSLPLPVACNKGSSAVGAYALAQDFLGDLLPPKVATAIRKVFNFNNFSHLQGALTAALGECTTAASGGL
ncbi:MAG: hypothetical protein H6707_20090 [Deltaproteobacteria bacterium]|nr:hypothetical protein [Deltaproteobacteria bacterium]